MIKFFAKERLDLISEKGIIKGYLLNESGNYITGEVETEKTDLIHIKRKEVKQILSDDYDFFWKVRNSLRKAETPFSWDDFKIFER